MNPSIKPEERSMLKVLKDNSGEASMAEIRENTDLNASQRRYRFETLEEKGLITVRKDDSLTPPNQTVGMKVAELSPAGYEAIQQGALKGEVYSDDSMDVESEISKLKDRMDDLEETVEALEIVASIRNDD